MKASSYVLKDRILTSPAAPPAAFEDASPIGNDGTHTDITWVRWNDKLWVRGGNVARTSAIAIPYHSSFDFVSSSFSFGIWMYPITMFINSTVMLKSGGWRVSGYFSEFDAAGKLWFYTNQTGTDQSSQTPDGTLTVNNWQLIVITRAGASARIYRNAVDRTTVVGVHVNPLASATTLKIANNNANSTGWEGYFSHPFVCNYALDPSEIKLMFDKQRLLFGV